jgi:hypothetical protein
MIRAARHSIDHQRCTHRQSMIPVRSLDEISPFRDECEEHEFWSTHSIADDL